MNLILETIKKRLNLLLVVQVLTLLTWMFLVTLQWLLSPKIDNIDVSTTAKVLFTRAITVFIVSFLLFKIYDLFQHKKKTIVVWAIVVALVVISSYLVKLTENTLIYIFKIKEAEIFSKYFFYTGSYYITPLLLLTGIYFAVRHWENAQIQKENTLKSEALAHEAQLQMLRFQINPHFLFNSLNTIRATIVLDQDKARHIVTLLSDFFRYTLEKDQEQANTIGKEIDAIKNYLNIQKIRFEEKLEFNFNIDLKTQNIEIPFFIIHPLVENAVKYGIETSTKPLKISIKSTIVDNNLIIEVSNSGSLIAEKDSNIDSTNTGIENINKRLNLVYPGNYEFSLKEYDKNVVAKLIIKNIVN